MASDYTIDPPKPALDRSQLPPGPPELPVIGQAFRLRNDLIGLMREAATYGDVSTVSVNPILICLVNHPELNRQVLVTNHQNAGRGAAAFEVLRWLMGHSITTSNGSFHLKQRRLIQPQFHRRRIEKYGETMTDFAAAKAREWEDGSAVDMEAEMRDLTLRIIVRALFDVELTDFVRRIGESFEESNDYMYRRLTQPVFLRRILHSLPAPATRRFKEARSYLDEAIYGMITERRRSGAEGDDLLSLLLQARYEDAGDDEDDRMSDQQVRDEVISLYIAGHDTTATTLTWAFYLLSQNPEIERQLHEEVDDVLGGRPPTLDDLPSLTLTEQIVSEVLRLYPPFWSLGRMVYEPIELGGHSIPPGVTLVVSPLLTQRDPRWFDAPDEFRPQRWTPDYQESLPRFAYIPFGGGPHKCIGEGFAWMEAKIALAELAQRWRARHVPDHDATMMPRLSLTPKGGMPMILERRN